MHGNDSKILTNKLTKLASNDSPSLSFAGSISQRLWSSNICSKSQRHLVSFHKFHLLPPTTMSMTSSLFHWKQKKNIEPKEHQLKTNQYYILLNKISHMHSRPLPSISTIFYKLQLYITKHWRKNKPPGGSMRLNVV